MSASPKTREKKQKSRCQTDRFVVDWCDVECDFISRTMCYTLHEMKIPAFLNSFDTMILQISGNSSRVQNRIILRYKVTSISIRECIWNPYLEKKILELSLTVQYFRTIREE